MEKNSGEHPSAFIAQHYLDVIRSSAGEAEQLKSLHPKQLQIIFEAGWFRMFVPAEMGGLGWPLSKVLRTEEALSWADGSTGWVVTLCSGAGWFAGFLGQQIVRELLSDRQMCLAGSGAATGVAEETAQGYRVTGTWRYASGALHATAFTANCYIVKNGVRQLNADGTPVVSAFIFRKGEVNLQNQWESMGMIATGSHSFKVNDILVPRDRRFVIDAKSALISEPVYQYPFRQLAETTLSVNLSGMAVRFLDLCQEFFYGKTTADSSLSSDSKTKLQAAIKELDECRRAFYDAVQQSWALCVNENAVPDDVLWRVSDRSLTLARTSLRLVDELYPWCGLTAANPREEINRVWRNIHTASQHALFRMG